eukprot:350425-Chlamydomonas_euryale.AAC.1
MQSHSLSPPAATPLLPSHAFAQHDYHALPPCVGAFCLRADLPPVWHPPHAALCLLRPFALPSTSFIHSCPPSPPDLLPHAPAPAAPCT